MAARASAPVADALWFCLCPAFALRPLPIRVHALQRLRPLVPKGARRLVQAAARPSWGRRSSERTSKPLIEPSRPLDNENERLSNEQEYGNSQAVADLLEQLEKDAADSEKPQVQDAVLKLVRDHGQLPSAQHYAALLAAEADPVHGSAQEVARLLKQLEEEAIPPNSAIYHGALKALAIHPEYILREQILAELERRWLDLSELGWHYVVAGLFRERQIELALERMSAMRTVGYAPAAWLLHLAISVCLSVEAFPEALTLLKHRTTYHDPVPSALWSEVLTHGAHAFCHPVVDYVWRRAVEASNLNPSTGTCVAVLDTAARHGNFRLAADVFRVLEARNSSLRPHHYESLFEAYLTAGDLPTALSVLALMTHAGHGPSPGCMRPLVQFLAERASTRVPHCLALLADPSILPDTSLSREHVNGPPRASPAPILAACIEALVQARALDAACDVLRDWPGYAPKDSPPPMVFNALLRGVRGSNVPPERQRQLAAEWMAAMQSYGTEADALTLDRLVLVQLGPEKESSPSLDILRDALQTWETMRGHGWVLRQGTAAMLVRKLAICGMTPLAKEIAKEHGVAWDTRALGLGYDRSVTETQAVDAGILEPNKGDCEVPLAQDMTEAVISPTQPMDAPRLVPKKDAGGKREWTLQLFSEEEVQ